MSLTHGFELIREEQIKEINSLVRLYRHAKTGAELLSIVNDDDNKCFGVSFTTPPPDSSGMTHILEHSVLCGSRKYPVKEPFIELVKGSLATFINAVTFPDKTVYPVASTNTKDFYNLVDVYLDAVFFPNITPETLQQEGWHYELESVDAPLTFKGVVFNEMKGAYSSPEDVLDQATRSAIFPDNVYRLDSGGDPRNIPELTYENFRAYHETYYHPSNARFYFYGDDNADQRLKLLDEVLQEFDPIQVDTGIELQPKFDAPRHAVQKYDAGDSEDDKGMVTVSWLLTEAGDTDLDLAFDMLGRILMGNSAAPLKKALIDSGLGEDTIGGGVEDLKQLSYTVGMKGIDPADADQVEAVILTTLQQLATEGIDPATIEAAINTIEFQMREYNTGGFPRGLAMMFDVLSSWNYGGDPFEPLAYEPPLNAIKTRLVNGEKVFENLIAEYLLNNPHRVTVVLEPDGTINEQLEAEEQAKLDAVRNRLTETELQQIVEDTERLRELQETPNTPEALATLPMLTLDDLEKQVKLVPNQMLDLRGTPLMYHDLFTNGIVYLDVVFNMRALPQEYLPYVGLFSRALMEMGTTKEDFVRLMQRIGSKTGGIGPSTFLSQRAVDDDYTALFVLRGKGTMAQVPDLLEIMSEILTITRFDNRERFRQIALKMKAGREAGLVPGGSGVVNRRLDAGFDVSGWASEQMGGIENLFFLRNLLTEIDTNWDSIVANLEAIRHYLLNQGGMLVNLTLDYANFEQIQPLLADFVTKLPAGGGELTTWIPAYNTANEGLTIPAQVNYVGKGANLYHLGYQLNGAAYVVPRWLGTDWLWERVRMMGGAYGAFASFDPYSGIYSYLSYRDPNLLTTLDNYDSAAEYLRNLDLSNSELTKSIIGTISDIDGYQLPDAKGYSQMLRYFVGMTDERRQHIREMVLSTSAQDFRAFGDVLAQMNSQARVVVLGSPDAIEEANTVNPGMLKVMKVL